jgi:hypothetical protein
VMLDRIGDCCDRTHVDTSERESIEPQVSDDRSEVSDSPIKTEILNVSVGRSHPAMVVSDHPPSESDQSVRDFPGVRESEARAACLAEDVGCPDERRAIAVADIGDANAIAGRGVLHRQRDHRHTNRGLRIERQRSPPSNNLMASFAALPIKGSSRIVVANRLLRS